MKKSFTVFLIVAVLSQIILARTISIWVSYNDEEYRTFTEIVQNYEELKGVKVKIQRIPFDGTEQKVLTALATRTAPDIARVDCAFVSRLALRGGVCALNEFGAGELVDELVPAAVSGNIIDGKIYGIPDQTNCLCLFYNKRLFREAGLDPEKPPSTWEEFISYGEKLTDVEKEIFGFGMRNTLWWTLPFFYTFGARFIDEGKCVLNTEEAVEGLQFKVDLYSKYKIEAGAWKSGAVDPDMGFQNDKYAMVLSGPWRIKILLNIGIDFGVGMIPKGPAGTATTVGGTNMVIFRGTKDKELAFDFLKFLVSKENQTRWANELGQIPVNVNSFDDVDLIKHPYLETFLHQMKTAVPRPVIPDYPAVENVVNQEIEAALSGKRSVEETLSVITEKVNKLLEEE
ncbi:MAG: extracellular solute-binding protein [candidate division WOR-3 bacterium]|nr:extracellular solute-binding protein [candidate division WOR-3 bacterium]